MLDQCWASVVEGGPALIQHWVDISCLLGDVTQRHYNDIIGCPCFFLLRTRLVVGVARMGPPLIYYRIVNITITLFRGAMC